MPYLAGGYVWSHADATRTQVIGTTGLATPGTSESIGVSRQGWALGGGLDYHVYGGWSVFAQYAHSQYGRINAHYPVANIVSKSTLHSESVSLGVDYKF